MRKTIICLSLFVLIALMASQGLTQEKTIIAGFASFPVGDFGSTDLDKGGFAETGWGIALDSRMSGKKWPQGLEAYFHSTYQWNKMNTEAVARAYTEYFNYKTTVSESRYSPIIATLGPSYYYAMNDKIEIGIYSGAGVLFNNTKAFTVKIYDDMGVNILNEVVNFDNRPAFAYMFGIDIDFEILEDMLKIGIFADYSSAKQKTELSFSTAEPADTFQKLQYLNAGIKFIFIKGN